MKRDKEKKGGKRFHNIDYFEKPICGTFSLLLLRPDCLFRGRFVSRGLRGAWALATRCNFRGRTPRRTRPASGQALPADLYDFFLRFAFLGDTQNSQLDNQIYLAHQQSNCLESFYQLHIHNIKNQIHYQIHLFLIDSLYLELFLSLDWFLINNKYKKVTGRIQTHIHRA